MRRVIVLQPGERRQSVLLALVTRERVPLNRRRISQKFFPAGVTSPFVARAMPTDAV